MSARHPTIALAAVPVLAATLLIASCGGSSTPANEPTRPADGLLNGARLFEAACASCHGAHGEGGLSGVPLNGTSVSDPALVIDAIRYGIGAMPASSDGMSDEQISALAEYVAGFR